jgi:uncharacterized oxidoreductase
MRLGSNTVLVTGGASGIGLAIATRFLEAGSSVIICGRRHDTLREAQEKQPALHIHPADVSTAAGRIELHEWTTRTFPRVNVLVNNAGIQRRMRLLEPGHWDDVREEIAINFEAPVHLTQLFIPHLVKQERAAIVNVTSGLAFAPLASTPVYCATKAALRSFTLSLRHQLASTPVEVVEIIPPAVNTDLGGPGLHTSGVAVDEFADSVMSRVDRSELEVASGFAEQASRASRPELDAMFQRMNQPR